MIKLYLPEGVVYVQTIIEIRKYNATEIRIKYSCVYPDLFNQSSFGNFLETMCQFKTENERNKFFIELEKMSDGINGIKPNLAVVIPIKPKK